MSLMIYITRDTHGDFSRVETFCRKMKTTKAAGVGHKTIVIGGAYSVDKSTEEWLEQIDKKLDYRKWYAGHYHIEKKSINWRSCSITMAVWENERDFRKG